MRHHNDSDKVTFLKDTDAPGQNCTILGARWTFTSVILCVNRASGQKKRRKRKSMFVNGAVCNALGCKIMAQGKETHTQHTEFYVGFCDGSLP